MKKKYITVTFSLSLMIICKALISQVVINEYSCSNLSNFQDNYNQYEDWVELYNTGSTAIDLSGYFLSDRASNPTKWKIPNGVSINPNGRLMVICSGRDEFSGGYLHPNFKLTQTKPENFLISNPIGVLLESITLVPTQKGHSRGRTTDGASTWALFTTPTPNASNTGAKQEYATKPVMSQNAGFYPSPITITITSPDPNVSIYYTTNGSEPTTSSTLYTSPITIGSTQVIRARAFSTNANIPPSFIESNTYFINENHSIAVISIFGNQIQTLLNGSQIKPETELEYFDNNKQLKTEVSGYSDKHGNDSWAYQQRGIDFVSRDQLGLNYALTYKIFSSKNRNEFQRVILKALANDNYPFSNGGAHIRDPYVQTLAQRGDLHLDVRTYEPCVLYVNGQYWGLYDLREKVDDADYIEYYFDTPEKDIQMLKTWGGTWSEYGGSQAQNDWNALRNFITSNNMAIPSNYAYVDSVFNIKSLVDYFVLNSYVVCSDWLNWNTQWWRGLNANAKKKKWRYCLWDEDATFGHYINYTNIPNQNPDADPCFPQFLNNPGGQGHTLILNALLNNPDFKQYYITRFADLSNTVFTCNYIQFLLDSLVNEFLPEMPRHIARWGGSMATWQNNLQALKDFIDTRCVKISTGMINCYNLKGPYAITFDVNPPNSGEIKTNSFWLPSYPFTGKYYGNIKTLLKAKSIDTTYVFDHWEVASDTILPSILNDSAWIMLNGPQTIIAHFRKITEPPIVIEIKPLVIPNVFTPNNDGLNDKFVIKNIENWKVQLTVYNRWGNKVYENNNYDNEWDGSKLPAGVYFYFIVANAPDKPTFKQHGSLEILR